MKKDHHIIIIPGLGDRITFIRIILKLIPMKNVTTHVFKFGWTEVNSSYNQKQKRLEKFIKSLNNEDSTVSLLGISAGGSAAMNAFFHLKDSIKFNSIINVCGRLEEGKKRPSLNWTSRKSPAFKESVLKCEKIIEKLNLKDKKKILIFHGIADEVVPVASMKIDGVKTIRIPMAGHLPSIFVTMTVYQDKIQEFIQKM